MENIKQCENDIVKLRKKYENYINEYILNSLKSYLNSVIIGKYYIYDLIIKYTYDYTLNLKAIQFINKKTDELIMQLSKKDPLFISDKLYKMMSEDNLESIKHFSDHISKMLSSLYCSFLLHDDFNKDKIYDEHSDSDSDEIDDILKYDNDIGYDKINNELIKINNVKK